MRIMIVLAALGLAGVAHAAPQATTPPAAKGMNYDCTKAGNKNKTACKNVTPGGVAAPAKPAMAAAPAMAAKAPAKPMNYDCTKAGNKNKAACKNVVVPPAAMAPAKPMAAPMAAPAKPAAMAPARPAAPMAAPRAAAAPKAMGPNEVTATLKNGKVVHYDCSKAGNKDKKACAGR